MPDGSTTHAAEVPASPGLVSDVDMFALLFADAHGRVRVTQSDRLIGEKMRALAHRWGWRLAAEATG